MPAAGISTENEPFEYHKGLFWRPQRYVGIAESLCGTIQTVINGPGGDAAESVEFHTAAVFAHGNAAPLAGGEEIAGDAEFTVLHGLFPAP